VSREHGDEGRQQVAEGDHIVFNLLRNFLREITVDAKEARSVEDEDLAHGRPCFGFLYDR